MTTAHEPIHPGEILLEEFLNPMGIAQYRLAQSISVPARASTRSCMASAQSPPTPPCGFLTGLEPPTDFG
jgi:plasmid maintenance system antidote protein VapI